MLERAQVLKDLDACWRRAGKDIQMTVGIIIASQGLFRPLRPGEERGPLLHKCCDGLRQKGMLQHVNPKMILAMRAFLPKLKVNDGEEAASEAEASGVQT